MQQMPVRACGQGLGHQDETVPLIRRILGVTLALLGVGPILAMLIIVVAFVLKSISDLDRSLEKAAEKALGSDDGDFEDEEWR